jgi:endonuclease/exonuclease/phosphatase (EEP) superfamily protein YafD
MRAALRAVAQAAPSKPLDARAARLLRVHPSARLAAAGPPRTPRSSSPVRWRPGAKLTKRPEADVFRLATFNVLAPCHKRMAQGMRESAFASICHQRQLDILNLLVHEHAPTAFCLQEFWFTEAMRAIYRRRLGEAYHLFALKRPRSEDGILTALNLKEVQVLAHQPVVHQAAGRVSLLLLLHVYLSAGLEINFLLGNTHLNYPHGHNDTAIRLGQAEELTAAIDAMCRAHRVSSVIVVGDFNGNLSDTSCQHMLGNGFVSAYGLVHRKELHVTHRDHRGLQVGVDFVFVRDLGPRIVPINASVLPDHASDEVRDSPWFPFPVGHHVPQACTYAFPSSLSCALGRCSRGRQALRSATIGRWSSIFKSSKTHRRGGGARVRGCGESARAAGKRLPW